MVWKGCCKMLPKKMMSWATAWVVPIMHRTTSVGTIPIDSSIEYNLYSYSFSVAAKAVIYQSLNVQPDCGLFFFSHNSYIQMEGGRGMKNNFPLPF